MEMIERAVARNLLDFVAAAQQVAPSLSAAAIACAGGVAAFLGNDSPLTTVKGAGPELGRADVVEAETFFQGHGSARIVFELAPWATEEAIELLIKRGYEVGGFEDVVARRPPFDDEMPVHSVVPVSAADWPPLMLAVNEPADSTSWVSIVDACAVLPDALRFAVLDGSGASVACAELMPSAGVGLFGNDATLASARKRGAQTAAIQQRLRSAAELGLSLVAAEVAPGSSSERNYVRCGFVIAYTRTHYVRLLDL
jgi:hypothetical protein